MSDTGASTDTSTFTGELRDLMDTIADSWVDLYEGLSTYAATVVRASATLLSLVFLVGASPIWVPFYLLLRRRRKGSEGGNSV